MDNNELEAMLNSIVESEVDQWIEDNNSSKYETEDTEVDELVKYENY